MERTVPSNLSTRYFPNTMMWNVPGTIFRCVRGAAFAGKGSNCAVARKTSWVLKVERHGARAALRCHVFHHAELRRRIFVNVGERAVAVGAARVACARIKTRGVHPLPDRSRRDHFACIRVHHHIILLWQPEKSTRFWMSIANPLGDSPGASGQRRRIFKVRASISITSLVLS